MIDPQCYYDPDNNRFVVDITTLYVDADGNYNGKNTIDVAVSNTGDPTGAWTIYHVPAQNDGTDGTPNHGCTTDGTTPGPCFQDYPHIGADKYGVYITTNEYDLFGPNYNAAQIFAFSKAQLAAHPAVDQRDARRKPQRRRLAGLHGLAGDLARRTVREREQRHRVLPQHDRRRRLRDGQPDGHRPAHRPLGGHQHRVARLGLAGPQSTSRLINSETYVFPPKADQKPGNIPLADCINNTTTPTPFGPGCWQIPLLRPAGDRQPEVEVHIDSNDTRMQQTWYVNGMLWGAADTAVWVNGQLKAGIAWFAVSPKINGAGKVEGQVKKQGYLALANNNLTYPAIAMGANGKGAIAFTVVGEDYYPSAGYATDRRQRLRGADPRRRGGLRPGRRLHRLQRLPASSAHAGATTARP